MTEIKRQVQDDGGVPKEATGEPHSDTEESGRSRTAGTNRDFDEEGTSVNQGHGHPREERRQGGD